MYVDPLGLYTKREIKAAYEDAAYYLATLQSTLQLFTIPDYFNLFTCDDKTDVIKQVQAYLLELAKRNTIFATFDSYGSVLGKLGFEFSTVYTTDIGRLFWYISNITRYSAKDLFSDYNKLNAVYVNTCNGILELNSIIKTIEKYDRCFWVAAAIGGVAVSAEAAVFTWYNAVQIAEAVAGTGTAAAAASLTEGIDEGITAAAEGMEFGPNEILIGLMDNGATMFSNSQTAVNIPKSMPIDEFYKEMIVLTVKNGDTINFNLNGMDLQGIMTGTGLEVDSVLGKSLLFIKDNWYYLKDGVRFLQDGIEEDPPWLWGDWTKY